MSLRDLNASTRGRLRFHGWMLTLWCVFVGVATSGFLLHVMHLRAPAARYAISGVVMYCVGLLVVASAAAGWLLAWIDPGAASIGDLFHRVRLSP
jgi:hydrogenase/urease accessory protein HupE